MEPRSTVGSVITLGDVRVFSVQPEKDGVVVLLAFRLLRINGFSFSIYQYPESYFIPPSQVN